ncbi:hypothetical protein AB0L04_00650 [Streptomyces glaucescens]|uniref:hypothetical protein n=1 Tax=Streptomyces glaucescens TaxID=1907 RepID=UPI00344BCC67
MTYRLHLDPSIHAIYASLPDKGRRDIGVCLLDALADPLAHSVPYGVDDGIMRTLAHGSVTIAVLLDHDAKAITVVQIGYAG